MKEKDSIRGRSAQSKKQATQRFLPIAEIHDDTIVLKNGGLRAILRTSSVNFNLKSEEEQNALVYGYQSFLNALEFPIQILVRSKKLDIDKYIQSLDELASKQSNPLLQKQTKEYSEYIEKLVEYADIMEKQFYVVIPVDPPTGTTISFIDRFLRHIRPDDTLSKALQRKKDFKVLLRKLNQRVNQIEQGLGNCNLRVEKLGTKELIELLYRSYNPITAREQKLQDTKNLNVEGMNEK